MGLCRCPIRLWMWCSLHQVSKFMILISAPGITAPEESLNMLLRVAFVCAKQSAAHSIPSTSILRTFIDFEYSSLSDSDAADGSVAMHVARISHSTSPVGRFRPFTINTSNKPDYSESSPIGDPCQRFPLPFHATAHDCPTHSSVDDCNFLLLRVFLLHGPRLGASGMTDTSVFEEFVRRYQDMVYGKAVRLLGDPVRSGGYFPDCLHEGVRTV